MIHSLHVISLWVAICALASGLWSVNERVDDCSVYDHTHKYSYSDINHEHY